eukprot:g5641.t1
MDDIGFKADPKNNDMKELFVGLDIAQGGESAAESCSAAGGEAAGSRASAPSAAQTLLDYRRQKKEAEEAAAETAKKMLKEGKGPASNGSAAAVVGLGLARAAGMAAMDAKEAAEDERYLRKANLSKTAARMSSKQKRRRKQGKEHGTNYEDRYAGKVINRSKRKGRMLAMKQMY